MFRGQQLPDAGVNNQQVRGKEGRKGEQRRRRPPNTRAEGGPRETERNWGGAGPVQPARVCG
jgi:hypothetical protein